MEAPKTLRRPANWQDFETLCKKLWGEIWQCPEIQKNGRLGQEQNGVDVYGIPANDNGYYGIQCKGKSEYTNKQFSEQEIDSEIEKAKTFTPPLKKLYLATTALSDSNIQAYVRQKNLEHKSKGIFDLYLFSWEDIVDLIDENKQTHNWYVLSQNYKSNKSVVVTFSDDSSEITAIPTFKRNVSINVDKNHGALKLYSDPFWIGQASIFNRPFYGTKINLSYFEFQLKIKNCGIDPIEEFKVLLSFEGEIIDLADTNEKELIDFFGNGRTNTILTPESMSGKITPFEKILVSDDHILSSKIFVKTAPKQNRILIKWKLISKNYKVEGELLILVEPKFNRSIIPVVVSDVSLLGLEKEEFEDYTVNKKD